MMASDLAQRLRTLRDRERWTVADMAYKTGIPKRTLDKYMLREGASLPGFEAVLALSQGLGVSLDWLLLGEERSAELSALLANHASTEAGKTIFEGLHRFAREGTPALDGEMLFGLHPEVWAAELGARIAEVAKELAREGVSAATLQERLRQDSERLNETLQDRLEAAKMAAKGR
jgi:transcriptional regulator with XRE-family HTH domain